MSEILFQPLGNPVAAGESLEHIADIDPRMTRTHYFDGRLLTAEDLERDQIYLDQRLREIGKTLGQGVIDGLELSFDSFSGLLTLQPGRSRKARRRYRTSTSRRRPRPPRPQRHAPYDRRAAAWWTTQLGRARQ